MKAIKKVALAYSGGLDTSIIIPWLKENYGCDVVAIAVDVGQQEVRRHLDRPAAVDDQVLVGIGDAHRSGLNLAQDRPDEGHRAGSGARSSTRRFRRFEGTRPGRARRGRRSMHT